MAEIRWNLFADAVDKRLAVLCYSFTRAVVEWPELNKAMLSRACNAKPLSAANYLLICHLLRLDPHRYFKRDKRRRVTRRVIAKTLTEQPVTVSGARETQVRS
ncbi:hypothetical protein GA830_12095 [Mesorhizobium sp. NBSH29]|uniref:hypothetical protein n=1 Tax=Mesorhizobium sp. NBSH29 TaxID=2654249 RepID=UPI00189687B9|nr:hypothetical protein [Mesorhizobium sp. NBSH29]QPC87398.1 hypothetical protein GA830_12095 [Mesorhizobium sp. NBSH29]